jgi:hypothetical protein
MDEVKGMNRWNPSFLNWRRSQNDFSLPAEDSHAIGVRIPVQRRHAKEEEEKSHCNNPDRSVGYLRVRGLIGLFGMMFNMICKGFCRSRARLAVSGAHSACHVKVFFIISIFTAQAELFEAKDNDLLLSMPIKPRTILLSRIGIMIQYDYLFLHFDTDTRRFLYCR